MCEKAEKAAKDLYKKTKKEVKKLIKDPEDEPGYWISKMFEDISKQSAAKQLTVGAVTGFCSGFVCTKVGKIAAMSIGGSLLILQFASHQGYVKVNWTKLNRHMDEAKEKLEKNARKKLPPLVEEAQRFIEENILLATGFAGGFLLGIASS
jgi:FUN14 domain-containing protein 1